MLVNGKISYFELEQLVYLVKQKVENSYLKKIYHYEGLWLFKFNHFYFVFEPGINIWIGEFKERESNLHSLSIKIRKEIGDQKILSFDLVENDKTIVIQFKNHKLVLELYAKGNLILLNNENKVIVLTRIYSECSHGKLYNIKEFKDYTDYEVLKYGWVTENKEIGDKYDNFNNILEAMEALWKSRQDSKNNIKVGKKEKKNKKKFSIEDNINNQISGFNNKINKKLEEVEKLESVDYNEIDYKKLEEIHNNRKLMVKKMENAELALEEKQKSKLKEDRKPKVEKTKLFNNQWYQKYHWWYTKNNFLVVGGRNATDNEKLVKTYLGDNDLYFHSEDPGSGSFILFTENNTPDFSDIDETAEGVLALSTYWGLSSSGDVFYVKGSQVTKTAPSGEYVGKGSFMTYGKKEIIKINGITLGYCIYDNKLMLAPFRIISRINGKNVKLKPRTDIKKMKGRIISNALKKNLNIELNDDLYIFNKPCTVT
mgnify:CR=1 FL=1